MVVMLVENWEILSVDWKVVSTVVKEVELLGFEWVYAMVD
jgi:hypothetical protein